MGRRDAWRSACAGSDPKSIRAVEAIRNEWNEIKKRPPAERETWLKRFGIAAHGAQTCNQLLREIERQYQRALKIVPAASWLESFFHQGISLPIPPANPLKMLRCPANKPKLMTRARLAKYSWFTVEQIRDWENSFERPDEAQTIILAQILGANAVDLSKRLLATPLQTRHGVRMRMSRAMLRVGDDGVPHRRWTPPQAVTVEDAMDSLSAVEAIHYDHPASPSALAIERIAWIKAREVGWRMHLRILGQ